MAAFGSDKPDTLRYALTQQVDGCISASIAVLGVVRKAPEQPVLAPLIAYCIDAKAAPLSATGSNLRWYTQPDKSGNVLTSLIPATTKAGLFSYYATQADQYGCESLTGKTDIRVKPLPTAQLMADSVVYRYDSLRVQLLLTGDAPWQVTLWNGKSLTINQSPYTVFVKPDKKTSYAIQTINNECGTGTNGNTLTVNVLEPLAVQDNTLRLVVQPNPFTTTIRIHWTAAAKQPVTLRLISIDGRVIRELKQIGLGNEQIDSWDGAGLTAGVYVVQLQAEQGQLTQRVLKQ